MPASLVAVILLSLLLLCPGEAVAEALRLLEGLRVEDGAGSSELHIGFSFPVRYLGHSPHVASRSLRVQIAPTGVGAWNAGRDDETLQPDSSSAGALERVRVEYRDDGATVEVRFKEAVAFEVSQGRDLRSLVVRLPAPRGAAPGSAEAPRTAGAGAEPSDPRAAELLEEGRRAFTAGEFRRAALIFGEASRLPPNASSAEALELLGLARERTGQLAHAKAEYQEYLRRYPDGEGASRVRQRLAALDTSHATPRGPLRPAPESRPRIDFQTFGSLYASFRREELFADGIGTLVDNSLLTDMYLDARLRQNGTIVRSQLAASYWHGFLERGSEGEARIYSGFLETSREGLTASVGRRSASSRGVIGRYDGAQVAYRLGDRWELGAIGGFPLDTPTVTDFDTSRYFAGLSAELRGLFDAVDVNLFGVEQRNSGMNDRTALGGEMRYFAEGRTVVAFLDFDLYFRSLNVAQVLGSWQVTPRIFVSAMADHRNVPILTTGNALIGQPVGSLDALSKLYSESEIKQLAEDRTAKATTLSLNGSYQLTPLLQISGDVVGSYLSGTSTSGGVEGFEGTGLDMSYVVRLVANEVLAPGDVAVVTLRYFDGHGSDLIGATLDARYPITRDIRLNPRLWADYRLNEAGGGLFRLVPSLRCDWRILGFQLESELGFEWFEPVGGLDATRLGYFVMLGARYDF